jgi:seryl-tRNA synthetase
MKNPIHLEQSASRLLTLQRRRHDELTEALARAGQQRDDALARLCKLDTKYRELTRKVGRSGKRLVETRDALREPVARIAPPAPDRPQKRADLDDDLGALLGRAKRARRS